MVVSLVHLIVSATKATYKVIGLVKDINGASDDVSFRSADLTAVKSSLEGLRSTLLSQKDVLDSATKRRLVKTLEGPVLNWDTMAGEMTRFLEQFELSEATGQSFLPKVIWRSHKKEIERLGWKLRDCKASLSIAIAEVAIDVETAHFRTLHQGLCDVQETLRTNHAESGIWMQELNGNVQRNHEEARGWTEDSNRTRQENLDKTTEAIEMVGKQVETLTMGALAVGAAAVVAGVWWYFSGGKEGEKKEEVQGLRDEKEEVVGGGRVWELKEDEEEVGEVMVWKSEARECPTKDGGVQEASERVKEAIKTKPKPMSKPKQDLRPKQVLKRKPKTESKTECPVPAVDRHPTHAAPATLATAAAAAALAVNNKQPSTATKMIEYDTTNTITNTDTTYATKSPRQRKNSTKKEKKFGDVMAQLKIRLNKKARPEVRVGVEMNMC